MTELSSTFSGHFSITRLFTKLGVLAFSLFTLYSLLFSPSAHAAQPPTIINYQGKLLNSSGQSVTTTVSITLVLYTASSGGTAVYTAGGTVDGITAISVTPTNGIFTISLGDGVLTNTLPPDIFQTNQNLYLDVYIGSDHLSPRKQVSAVPYAYNAKYLDGVAATTTASSSTYIPISDSIGNFNFRHITSTDIFVSGTSTLATTTFTGTVTVTKELIAQAIKDALGYIPNQATPAKLSMGFNNGGFGGGATPGNLSMTSTDVGVFNLTNVSSTASSFLSSVFDGRYVYLLKGSGLVVQYDTTASYTATSSWRFAYINGFSGVGTSHSSAIFDGRYVYFVPQYHFNTNSNMLTRYDTRGLFNDDSSWSSVDIVAKIGTGYDYSAGVFDGRYLYLTAYYDFDGNAVGVLTRYDSQSSFTSSAAWSSYVFSSVYSDAKYFQSTMFDGRYVYMLSSSAGGYFVRYDTSQVLNSPAAYTVFFDPAPAVGSGYVGGVFDGRYMYVVPYSDSYLLRYDTSAPFTVTTSWKYFRPGTINSSANAFSSGAFDGRYLTLVPAVTGGVVARYDVGQNFFATSSWSFFSVLADTAAQNFAGGVFDGRYLYAPGQDNGYVLRLRAFTGGVDTTNSLAKVARSSDFFLDSSSKVGIGTNAPTKLLTIQGTVSSTTGISIGTGVTTSSLDHERGLVIASTTVNRLGLFNINPVTGSVSASGTLRTFGGVTGMGISVSSTATTNTVFSYFTNNTVGNALVFDTNTTITSSTSALYSWRNNGFKLMSLSASGTLDVYGSISSMNASLGSPGTPGDLSERVDVKQSEFNELVSGDVLTVDLDSPDTYKKTTGNQTDPVMGVIATNPALILGNGKTQYTKILTFLGRTNVKVSLKNGVIHPGDPLTNATDEPGKAMKQTDAGPTIGTALEPYYEYTEQNQGQILVLVRPGWSKPSLARATAGEDSAVPSAVSAAVQSVMDGLRQLGVEIVEGVLHASHVVADSITSLFIRTNTICLEDVCLTEMQLQELLLKNSINAVRNPDESVTNTPSNETGTATSEAAPDQIPDLPASAPETTSSTP